MSRALRDNITGSSGGESKGGDEGGGGGGGGGEVSGSCLGSDSGSGSGSSRALELIHDTSGLCKELIDNLSTAETLVEMVSIPATEWLNKRFHTAPGDLLTQVVALDVIADLNGDNQDIAMFKRLVSESSLSAQHLGLKLVCHRLLNQKLDASWDTLPRQFLAIMDERFNGCGDVLVKQLLSAQVVNQKSITGVFEDLYKHKEAVKTNITLDDLQGRWRNSEDEDVLIIGNQCSFDDSPPMAISVKNSGTGTTYRQCQTTPKSPTSVRARLCDREKGREGGRDTDI